MAYDVETTDLFDEEIKAIRVFDQRRIVDEIKAQLTDQPTTETRKRKRLDDLVPSFEHEPPVWELRIGAYRVFYDVDETARLVSVREVRLKRPWQSTREIADERSDD